MRELVNFSNTAGDLQYLLGNDPTALEYLLQKHKLQGVEMMFAQDWDGIFPKNERIQGVHLRFWPDWLDFWRGDKITLQKTFPDSQALFAEYGSTDSKGWEAIFRKNLRDAVRSGAPYFVFHVTNMRPKELVNRDFQDTDRSVIDAAADFINHFVDEIPDDRLLLFENLWWAGLTLRDADTARHLLARVQHQNSGFMLDTGHMMVTNPSLHSEAEGVEFVLRELDGLGDLVSLIKGIHLHVSLAGPYIKKQVALGRQLKTLSDALDYTLHADCHDPFQTAACRRIVERIRPDYLVHEFVPRDFADWDKKLGEQRCALGFL